MITIITGKIDSGKTTRLLSIYNKSKTGDGFIIKKVYSHGIHIGQNVVRLTTGEYKPFSLKKGLIPLYWDEICRCGPYSFSAQGFIFADSIITDSLQIKSEPLYIDEIGPLELQRKGFFDILTLALSSGNNLYLAVRETCLQAVIREFNICSYELVNV